MTTTPAPTASTPTGPPTATSPAGRAAAHPAMRAASATAGLRRALLADTAASAGVGVLVTAGHRVLADPLGIPAGWLLGLGLFMVVYGLDVALLAARLPAWLPAARAIPALNGVWVAASVLLVLMGGFDLTALGVGVVLGQAAVVAGLAWAQARELRRIGN